MNSPSAYSAIPTVAPGARLEAVTPTDSNIFFGFHDVSPFSADGSQLLVHRIPSGWDAMANTRGAAEICVWEPASGTVTPVGSTTAWNFQQGARLQWLPDGSGRFLYNRMGAAGRLVAAVCEADGSTVQEIDGGIYVLARDGTWGIGVDFTALAHRWAAYGYAVLSDQPDDDDHAASGLWRIDMASGERRLLVSLAQVLAHWGQNQGSGHFLTHATISPDGQRIAFMHRFFSPDGGLFTRLLCCDAAGEGLRVLAEEKVSHFDWLDDRKFLVWARFAGGGMAQLRSSGSLNKAWLRPLLNLARKFTGRWKKRLLAECYWVIDVDNPASRERFGWPQLDSDGHPMFARRHDWLLTDTYPDASETLPLILYNPKLGKRIDVARVVDGVTTADTDAKCDLHPRWDSTETRIAVDHCENGRRGVAVFDVAAIVGAGA